MKPVQILIILLITVTGNLNAQSLERSVLVHNPVLPDSLEKLQVRLEVKQIRSKHENQELNIAYLSAEVLN